MRPVNYLFWTFFLFFLASSGILSAQQADSAVAAAGDSMTAPSEEVPVEEVAVEEVFYVELNRDTLFGVRAALGPYPAQDRAENLSERLKEIRKRDRIQVDSFSLSENLGYAVICYKDQELYYVTEQDAALIGLTQDEAAEQYLDAIQVAFREILDSRTAIYWLVRLGFTALSILGLVLIIVLLRRIEKWALKQGAKRIEYFAQRFKRKRKSLFAHLIPSDTTGMYRIFLKIMRISLIILTLIFYVPFMFSFLPWTEDLVARFYETLATPVRKVLSNILQYLPNLFYILVIVIIARWVIRGFKYLSSEIDEERLNIRGFHKDWARPTFSIIRAVLLVLTLVFIFPYLPGSDSPAFKGVSIFFGVLFSLGSTSAIANIVAGMVLTYMRPFLVGDRVKIGDSIGDVIEKNLLVTRIRTIKNEEITIPNALIINTHLSNFSNYASSIGIILHTSVTIGYDVPSETVNDLLLKAAEKTKGLTRDFKPFVLQKGLNDFYVEYELNVYTKQPKKMAYFYSEIHKSILKEFNEAGVEILSPHYSAFRDGNTSTIPAESPESVTKDPANKIIDKVTGKK